MKNLAVIVPAYNEEVLIEKTINSIPEKVNKIVIINDCSKDDTEKIVRSLMKKNEKIELINFDKNSGVGAALIAGYNYCYEKKYDIAVVMPGDAQALPVDFDKLIEPVVSGKADYAKGNRLKNKNVKEIMPRHRFIGNTFLTILTKFATGYFHIMDPQMGYTALNVKMLEKINIQNLIKRYGYPGQLLFLLNMADAKVVDVEVTPHYDIEKSGINLLTFVPKLMFLLIKLFIQRVYRKLLKEKMSPAGISYFFCFGMFLAFIGLLIRSLNYYISSGYIPGLTFMAFLTSIILFFIFFFFGVMFDYQDNQTLHSDI